MVYRGRPSKGCELCRSRKIKCSQDRPACEQCIKHGVPCPGYRDLSHANFLDESQAIMRRSRNDRDSPKGSAANRSLTPSLTFHVEDKAIHFFYARFVQAGFSSFLPDRLHVRDADSVLSNAVLCTAMAALANFTKSPQTLMLARKKYAKALTVTNAALGSSQRAKDDSTIAAVLMLGMFEVSSIHVAALQTSANL